MDKICDECGHPERRHPVTRFTDFGPEVVCGTFVDGGTLTDVFSRKLPVKFYPEKVKP